MFGACISVRKHVLVLVTCTLAVAGAVASTATSAAAAAAAAAAAILVRDGASSLPEFDAARHAFL